MSLTPHLQSDNRLVHKLVRKTAREMAGCFYEFAAHDDTFYRYYPSVKFFMDYEWQRFVSYARQTLTDMLRGNYPETYKAEIYDALLLDAELPYSVQEHQIVNFPH